MKDFYAYQLYIFDLDNTLYNEEDYLFGAYQAITAHFKNPDIYSFLKNTFQKDGRQMLFNKMGQQFGLPETALKECLDLLRTFKPEQPLVVDEKIKQLLKELKQKGKVLAILTNGNVVQQKNKVELLKNQLSNYFEIIVFANELEPKPSPKGIEYIVNKTGVGMTDTLVIGDSETDKTAAVNAGVDFLHVAKFDSL